MKYTLRLNKSVRENFVFFCPVSRIHLSLLYPEADTDVLSESVIGALKAGTILDVKGNIKLDQCKSCGYAEVVEDTTPIPPLEDVEPGPSEDDDSVVETAVLNEEVEEEAEESKAKAKTKTRARTSSKNKNKE